VRSSYKAGEFFMKGVIEKKRQDKEDQDKEANDTETNNSQSDIKQQGVVDARV
jgi:hypothetical protein